MSEPKGTIILPPPPKGFIRLEPDWTQLGGPPARHHLMVGHRPFVMTPDGRMLPVIRGGAVTAGGNYYQTFRDKYQNDIALDWLADDLKQALYDNTITPDFSVTTSPQYGAGQFASGEVGSPAGGISVSGRTITNASSVLTFDATDTPWGSQTFSGAVCALLYDNTLSPKAAILINWFGGTAYGPTNGVFTILHPAAGIHTADLY